MSGGKFVGERGQSDWLGLLQQTGALDYRTGEIVYVIGPRKTNLHFRQLLTELTRRF